MNKIYTLFLTAFLAVGFLACEDDDCDQLHIDTDMMGIPTVLKGSFPVGTSTPAVGDSIVFAPQLLDTAGVTYAWKLNGKEVSSDSAFTYKIEKPCRAKVVCTLKNTKGEVILEADIVSKNDLSKGILIIQKSSIDYYDAESGKLYSDVYSALNYGDGLSLGNYDDLYAGLINDKLYLMVSTSTSNVEHVYSADAKSLYAENSAVVSANLDGFIPLNDKQALVTGGGAFRVDLASLSKVQLYKKYGWAVYNGIVLNGKLLANMTYQSLTRVNAYGVDALLGATENGMPEPEVLDIWQDGKINFVKAADGNVYTIGCNEEQTEYYLVRIAPDLTVKKEVLPFKPMLSGYSHGIYTVQLTSGKAGTEIYIPAADQSVYKYTFGSVASFDSPFIAAPADGEKFSGVGVNVNPQNGELWICYAEEAGWNEYIGKVVVFDAAGKQVKTIDCGDTAPQAVLFNN